MKIPKEIILERQLPEHRLSVFLYLDYNRTYENTVHYSPIYMIQWSGYKPNWHRGTQENIYTKFRDCMQWYYKNEYLANFDEDKYLQSTFQSSLLNEEKMNPNGNFAILYDFEIERIKNYESAYKPLNKSILLLLLSYIRAFTWSRTNFISGHSEMSKKQKPEIFYSQFQSIAEIIGNNSKIVSRATAVLEDLSLIETYRMPRYKDSSGNWHTDDIIYVCPYKYTSRKGKLYKCNKEEYNCENELKYGITFLREKKYISKKFYQD